MREKETELSDYILVNLLSICGLCMSIVNACLCDGAWNAIWCVWSGIAIFLWATSHFLSAKDWNNAIAIALMYEVFSIILFCAGCFTACLTWGSQNLIILFTFPFGLVGIVLAPIATVVLSVIYGMGIADWLDSLKENEK